MSTVPVDRQVRDRATRESGERLWAVGGKSEQSRETNSSCRAWDIVSGSLTHPRTPTIHRALGVASIACCPAMELDKPSAPVRPSVEATRGPKSKTFFPSTSVKLHKSDQPRGEEYAIG